MKGCRVCVLGLGYIGLPTASVLATAGFDVVGVDVNHGVVETLRNGDVHIEEPGLRTLFSAALNSGRLKIGTIPEPADAFLICVPTPLTDTKTADLSYVVAASEAIAPHLRDGSLVIVESTIPPGTTETLVRPILELARGSSAEAEELLLVHCPERVIPGQVLQEIIANDRVIGGSTPAAAECARDLYSTFVEGELHLTDATTAEMVKLMENTFRDVNIALANELARISARLGLNAWEIIKLANHHPRVHLHSPGPGVGGHCLPIDPWFIVEKAPDVARLIRTAREINDGQPAFVAQSVREMVSGIVSPRVVLLGEAYKENVDDARESPTRSLIPLLEAHGIQTVVIDPHTRPEHQAPGVIEAACKDADLLVLLCAHAEFRALDPASLAPRMRHRRVLDTRAVLPLAQWESSGFSCVTLGNGRRVDEE